MAFTIADVSAILKVEYAGPIREQLNNAHVLFKMVRKNKKAYNSALQHYIPLHTGRNSGLASVGDGARLPDGGNQSYVAAIFTPTYHYAVIELTGPSLAATRNDIGSFMRGLKSEVTGAITDRVQDNQRQMWGHGGGLLTAISEATAESTTTTCVVNSTKYLSPNMSILVAKMDDGTTVTGSTNTVASITNSTTFELGTAINFAAITEGGYGIYRAKSVGGVVSASNRDPTSAATWATLKEMWGLRAICAITNPGAVDAFPGDTAQGFGTTYFGQINRTTSSFWKPTHLTNGNVNRDLTLDLMQQSVDEADIAAGKRVGHICTNHAGARRYAALSRADKRYGSSGDVKLDGGYGDLAYSGIPIYADKSAGSPEDPSQLRGFYFLNMPALEFGVLKDNHWLNEDGSMLHQLEGFDKWRGTHAFYGNLGAESCNRHVFLGDISETA
jgi:hypothetical protein